MWLSEGEVEAVNNVVVSAWLKSIAGQRSEMFVGSRLVKTNVFGRDEKGSYPRLMQERRSGRTCTAVERCILTIER